MGDLSPSTVMQAMGMSRDGRVSDQKLCLDKNVAMLPVEPNIQSRSLAPWLLTATPQFEDSPTLWKTRLGKRALGEENTPKFT